MNVTYKTLSKHVRSHLGSLLSAVLLIFLGVGAEALAPWPFKVLIDNVLGAQPFEQPSIWATIFSSLHSQESLGFFVVFLFCFSSALAAIADYFSNIATKKLGQAIVNDFSREAFHKVQELPIGAYKQQDVGDYIYRLSYDTTGIADLLTSGILPIFTNSLHLITTSAILFLISPKLFWLAIITLPLLVYSLKVFNAAIEKASKKSETSNSAVFSFIQEALSQLKIIQAFNQQHHKTELFQEKQTASLHEEYNVFGLGVLLNLLIGIVIAVAYAIIIAYGINGVFLGVMSTGLLIVFMFYLDNLTTPLLSLIAATTSIKESRVKIARVTDLFLDAHRQLEEGHAEIPDDPQIIFDHVSVVGDEGKAILHDVSFKIPAHKKTVILGISGSGKTTVANLILRFVTPSKGRILLNKTPANDIKLKKLRDAISYVPQELVLFHQSIAQNIGFGNPQSSISDIKLAARLACAEHFIQRLPGRYQFRVGEEGGNLSGGQRQRILLARAFTKTQSKILLFDEPLSALDIHTRSQVMASVNAFSAGKTAIIISNILEIMDQADYVIALNEGKLLYAGNAQHFLKNRQLSHLMLNSI